MSSDHANTDPPTVWGSGIATAEAVPVEDEDETRTTKKKEKKRRKKEEKHRRELVERFSLPTTPSPPPATSPAALAALPIGAEPNRGRAGSRIEAWSLTAARSLHAKQLIISQRANLLIGVNAFMLSVAAVALYRVAGAGQLWWAFMPVGLTNILSLLFALLSARVRPEMTPLEELCAMPQEDYQGALLALVNDQERVQTVLANEIYQLGTELTWREKHLGTAVNVLLGGLPLSAVIFGLCAGFLK